MSGRVTVRKVVKLSAPRLVAASSMAGLICWSAEIPARWPEGRERATNTMTIAILSQRIFGTSIRDHWDEVEGWLALGATPRQSTLELGRRAIHTALLPSVDQTRTTGIVVLPGAFVGAIFGGASPLEAGRFQVVVLASILAAGVLTAVTLTRLTGSVTRRPVESPR